MSQPAGYFFTSDSDVVIQLASEFPCKVGTDSRMLKISIGKCGYKSIIGLNHLKRIGIMAMLPAGKTEDELAYLCEKVRDFYDEIRLSSPNVKTLSMGMSGDYKTAIKHGSNMIRLGRAIFGERIQNDAKEQTV